ncbi:MAG: LURP-one-related family protein [Clostridia bacterium]|nr:LURP-one-related family protein [Clostridia bacterium]
MKVFIKNKIVSIGGSSIVTNEQGDEVFKIEGKVLSPRKKKLMYDKDGNLIYIIRNRFFNMFAHKVHIFDAEKNRLATIKKNKFSFNLKYQIENCVDEMELQGQWFKGESLIMKNGEQVGVIKKEFSIFADSYTLEADEKDIPFLTALCIAFDNLIDEKNKD